MCFKTAADYKPGDIIVDDDGDFFLILGDICDVSHLRRFTHGNISATIMFVGGHYKGRKFFNWIINFDDYKKIC